jgi:DNA-binding HxlR family transcriptional regulator
MKNTVIQNNKYCPIAEASKIVGDFWNILIIRELLKGCQRFNVLISTIDGITNSTLSDRLKNLVEAGIVERKQYESIPPKVEYSLTEKGRGLKALLDEIERFGKEWMPEGGPPDIYPA